MPSVNQPESPCLPAGETPRSANGAPPPAPRSESGPEAAAEAGPGPIQVSATLAANEVLARKRREGLHVLPMAFGEAGLPAHPAMMRELAAAAGHNAYGPVAGSLELRDAVAGYWSRRGLPTRPEAILCGPGSKPLLYALMQAIGGDVAVPEPSWVTYAAQARLVGREPEPVPTRPGEGGVPDPVRLRAALERARAAGRRIGSVVLTLPDNPTGSIASAETVRRVCDVARDHDLVVISDEIYRDLVHDPQPPVPSPALFAPERTVTTTALSKNLALGGWRLGVARLPAGDAGERLRARLLAVVSELWSTAPAPMQQAAAFAFGEPVEIVEHIARSRRLHAAVARAVAARFAACGATVAAPQAAFYVYPDFGPLRERLAGEHGVTTAAGLAGLLLDRYAVGVLPGSAFGEPAGALRLRVATSLIYGDDDEQRRAALAADDPLALPWIERSLDRLHDVLTDVGGGAGAAEPIVVARETTASSPAVPGPRPIATPVVSTA